MEKRTILLDCDGLLADFHTGAIKAHGRPEKHDDIVSWNFFEAWGMSAAQFYKPLHSREFWENLEPYPWAVDMYQRIKAKFPVVICTAPVESEECVAGKYTWLKKHLGVGVGDIVMASQKHLLALPLHILIDDGPHNIHKFQMAGGLAIGFKQPWNKFDVTHETIHDVLSDFVC